MIKDMFLTEGIRDMHEHDKTELFETMPVPRAIMTLAVPTILSSLVMILYNLADTFFVGMLNDPIQNAAVTLAGPVLLAFNAINNLFGIGSSSMMSRALGNKDYDRVKKTSAFGFYCSLIAGLLLSLGFSLFKQPLLQLLGSVPENAAATSDYLFWTTTIGAAPAILNVVMAYMIRSEGASIYASVGTMSGCILNIILDPVFVLPWGFNMGAAGAGLATMISNCAACLFFFVLLAKRRGKTFVVVSPRWFKPDANLVMAVFGVGIPAAIQNLLNVTGMTVLNNFTSEFGSEAVAAMGIASKIDMVPLYIALGLSQGMMPLVGYNFASGNRARMREAVRFSMVISTVFMIVMTVFYLIGADFLVAAFMNKPAIVEHGSRFLRGLCLALPFLSVDFMAVGVFTACGLGRYAFVFAVMRKIVLEIPALWVLNRLFPLYGLGYAQFTAELVLGVTAVVTLGRFFRRPHPLQKDVL